MTTDDAYRATSEQVIVLYERHGVTPTLEEIEAIQAESSLDELERLLGPIDERR